MKLCSAPSKIDNMLDALYVFLGHILYCGNIAVSHVMRFIVCEFVNL